MGTKRGTEKIKNAAKSSKYGMFESSLYLRVPSRALLYAQRRTSEWMSFFGASRAREGSAIRECHCVPPRVHLAYRLGRFVARGPPDRAHPVSRSYQKRKRQEVRALIAAIQRKHQSRQREDRKVSVYDGIMNLRIAIDG